MDSEAATWELVGGAMWDRPDSPTARKQWKVLSSPPPKKGLNEVRKHGQNRNTFGGYGAIDGPYMDPTWTLHEANMALGFIFPILLQMYWNL